jgi:hypothetical protein
MKYLGAPTFVQVSAQFGKLFLLQSNLQMKLVIASSSTQILPSPRNIVRLLYAVRHARTYRSAKDNLSANGSRQEEREVQLHGGFGDFAIEIQESKKPSFIEGIAKLYTLGPFT